LGTGSERCSNVIAMPKSRSFAPTEPVHANGATNKATSAKNLARTADFPAFACHVIRAAPAHFVPVDRGDVLNDHLANATGPHHRRRPRRLRGGLAARQPRRSGGAARNAPRAHNGRAQTQALAELVCSNSFRSDDREPTRSPAHAEMRRLGSLIMRCGDAHQVPAGGALAVDREDSP